MAITNYKERGTEDIARGLNTKEARKTLPIELHAPARRRLAYLAAVTALKDLQQRPGLGLHALKGDRSGEHAIKINDQYRVCFRWRGKNATDVEITDYH